MKVKSVGPAVQAIQSALEEAVLKVEPQLLADLTAAYREEADRRFNRLMEAAGDPQIDSDRFDRIGRDHYEYTKYDWDSAYKEWRLKWERGRDPDGELPKAAYKEMPPRNMPNREGILLWRRFLQVYYYYADKNAKFSLESAHKSFVTKNTMKFASILGNRGDLEDVVLQFGFKSGVFQGRIDVVFKDGDSVSGDVSLKYVVRTMPRVTPYYQYPLIFTSAVVGGRPLTRPSEAELAEVMRR